AGRSPSSSSRSRSRCCGSTSGCWAGSAGPSHEGRERAGPAGGGFDSGMTIGRERVWLTLSVVLVYVFLLTPIVVVVIAALNSGEYLRFPPEGFSVRWFVAFGRSRAFTRSLAFSLELAAIVTAIATVLGTMASLWLVRSGGRVREARRVLLISPLAVPGSVTGIALLILFSGAGWRRRRV